MSPDVVHGQNVGMVEGSNGTCFLLEAAKTVCIGRERSGEYFAGDDAIEPRVAGAVDFAHTSSAERSQDFVWTEFRAGGKSHE
jgi:hypothetical protein